jgi:hypothetical protein
MRGTIGYVHYVDFHSDARHAVCGWVPPEDYAGVTIYMTAASCPTCIQTIQQRVEALRAWSSESAAPAAAAASSP